MSVIDSLSSTSRVFDNLIENNVRPRTLAHLYKAESPADLAPAVTLCSGDPAAWQVCWEQSDHMSKGRPNVEIMVIYGVDEVSVVVHLVIWNVDCPIWTLHPESCLMIWYHARGWSGSISDSFLAAKASLALVMTRPRLKLRCLVPSLQSHGSWKSAGHGTCSHVISSTRIWRRS